MRSSDWSSDVCSSDLACVVGAMALFGGRPGSAAEFHCNACDVKASEVERCQRMDPAASVTGLLFNPSGMKTYFKRSSCLQGRAVDSKIGERSWRERGWQIWTDDSDALHLK